MAQRDYAGTAALEADENAAWTTQAAECKRKAEREAKVGELSAQRNYAGAAAFGAEVGATWASRKGGESAQAPERRPQKDE